ncbi:MAG: hypothetical protein IVW57_09195, partial [Ktedonobacterales bacterium]|nr:hypothetical protein [Ktedonobacterales bacterium]
MGTRIVARPHSARFAKADEQAPEANGLLARPFRAIIFDWDGTAVANRTEGTIVLAQLAERLLDMGVWLAIVTGTNFGNIDRQFCQHLAPTKRRHLLVCANRGSEVYGFDQAGQTVRRWLRVATPQEEWNLTAIAEDARAQLVAQTGLDIGIVYDRLNRRKIDLIPVAEWADPPKAHISALLAAVNQRLQGAGLNGGLDAAIRLTTRLARERGVAVRITSDVKHIEVGLTDKSDSLAWLMRELLRPEGIPWDAVLIAGDEFGPVAGFPGSDDRLRAEGTQARVVSVGAEPNGVPKGVLHLGGGPQRFRTLLAEQITLHAWHTPPVKPERGYAALPTHSVVAQTLMAPRARDWTLVAQDYVPALERDVEARLTVSNGAIGTRGSLEVPTRASRPRTMVAGLFGRRESQSLVPALLSGPDWLRLRLWVGGEPVTLESGDILAYVRTLDLQRGLVVSEWRHRTPAGHEILVRTVRCASLATRA